MRQLIFLVRIDAGKRDAGKQLARVAFASVIQTRRKMSCLIS